MTETKKPQVKKEARSLLKLRKKIKKKKPKFTRQENWRYGKLKKCWRKPKGIDSKLKAGKKSRGKTVRPGYSSPLAVRGLAYTGHKTVRVYNIQSIDKIHTPSEAAIIASGIGAKKRAEIIKHAEKKKIRVLNQ